MTRLTRFIGSSALLAIAGLLTPPVEGADAVADPTLKGYEEQSIKATIGGREETIKFLLLKPAKIEPDKKYPVILFLHGAGERGSDNRAQLRHFPEKMSEPARRERFSAFVIAPQCPAGNAWVNVKWSATRSSPQGDPTAPMQGVMAVLQHVLKSEPTDPVRVYLMGLSMGGFGSWDLATRHPDWFAAVAPICGGGDERRAAVLKDVPVWAFHGDKDNVVPVARTRSMIEAIRKAGGQPKYSELAGVGHDSWTPACSDQTGLLAWMFEQKHK